MRQAIQRERENPGPLGIFCGHGIYGREGRRIGAVRALRAGRPGGNFPYALVELAGFSKSSAELRAIPASALSYNYERGHFLCDLSEMSVRSAPSYTGAGDWLDGRWTRRLDEHYDAIR